MAISRRKALERLQAYAARVQEHLEGMAAEPESRAQSHWRREVTSWLSLMERMVPHVGKKTGTAWAKRIQEFRNLLD